MSEAFSRILIDKALENSGWDLLDPHSLEFEHHSTDGRADYILKDKYGRALCVIEAKKEELDPYDAKEQAPTALFITSGIFNKPDSKMLIALNGCLLERI